MEKEGVTKRANASAKKRVPTTMQRWAEYQSAALPNKYLNECYVASNVDHNALVMLCVYTEIR